MLKFCGSKAPQGMKEATMSESCLPASAFSLSHHHSMFEHAAEHVLDNLRLSSPPSFDYR